jgi:hypothetical protein
MARVMAVTRMVFQVAAIFHSIEGRRQMRTKTLFCAIAAAVLSPGIGHAQLMIPKPDEVQVGPTLIEQVVQGVPITVKVTSFMSISTSPTGLSVKARTYADLSDIQAKVGSIVDTFPLPRDNCRSYSANNPVVTVSSKRLNLSGNALVFTAGGEVVMWDCRENPIPNSKIEWKKGPFGIPYPKIVTWPGSPIKNKLLSQPVTASIPITLAPAAEAGIRANLGDANVELGGNPALSAVRDFLLRLFKVDVNERANEAIQAAVDPGKLQATLPPDFARLSPKIVSARFVDADGASAEIVAQATVVAANLTEILKAIADKSMGEKSGK